LIVDDSETEVQLRVLVFPGPVFKMADELRVRDDVCVIDGADGGDVVDDVFEHRLAGDCEQRLRLIECQWIKTRGVTRRQNDEFHNFSVFRLSVSVCHLSFRSRRPWF